jgi:hypothetical protein
MLIPLLQLSTPVIGFCYARQCDALSRRAAQPIVTALESYRDENGQYQSDLSVLVPRYLSAIPRRACALPLGRPDLNPVDDGWSLYFCGNGPEQETLLLVPMIGMDAQQVYNPKTGRWSRGTSLDGYCPRVCPLSGDWAGDRGQALCGEQGLVHTVAILKSEAKPSCRPNAFAC